MQHCVFSSVATIRSVKLHKESRRLGNRGFSSIDHGRTGRPPGSRSAFFQQDALRLNLRRSLLNARESLRESKDQLNGRFRNPGSAFSPALPTGKSNIQQLHSPTVSEPAGHNFFPHGQQPTPGEKSPASSETSLPSFSTGSESRLPFAPLESAYLLSFINDAYARLLARQLQMPASKYKNSDRTEDNQARNKIPVHGPVSSPNVDPQKFVSANGEMKPDFWRNINSVLFDRTGSSNVHSSFRTATQDFPGLPPLFSLSSAVRNVSKQAEMCSSRNSMGNGCSSPNPAWCSLLQQCDFRINKVNQFAAPNPGPFPNPILSTGFNQTGSLYGQTRNTDAISPPFAPTPGNPTFPAYDPTFYSILGSVFASMFQQTSFAPGGCGEKSGLLSVQNLTGNGVSPDDDLLQNSDPINLKLRHQDPLPNLNGTGDSCPKSSNNAILSIERVLEVTNNNNNNRQPELQLHNRNGLGSPSAMQRLEVACNLSQRSNMSRISPSFSKHGFTGHSFLL
ncbi:hypothetical protein CSKR_105017 [Clonorchis sinensis]|uniref:Uncharacterized protein n=1 Tax=Clonorchis sinensis TaxID=79923 RepID=A0A8T1M5P6_CLOSI|nr:hypothetical protein CSKR_105017 [Clonorchis sinensis]